jgi:transposase-like protein
MFFPHEKVAHSGKGEYVRGQVHTQNLDSFWSLIKRGIMGSFHHVSKGYLPLYVNEFSFRHNHREDPDMFASVVAAS